MLLSRVGVVLPIASEKIVAITFLVRMAPEIRSLTTGISILSTAELTIVAYYFAQCTRLGLRQVVTMHPSISALQSLNKLRQLDLDLS